MKTWALALAIGVLGAPLASAGHLGMGGFGGRGFGHHGGGELGGLGYNTERQQTRFEKKFEDLQSDYDDGLANIEDFFSSDEYSDVVDGTELLVDRHGLFLSGIERAVDRLDDYLGILNDDLTFYEDLLTEYQERDDLSEERLERLTDRLTNIQDHITDKIDLLTEKQTTLSENLGAYQTFSESISTYLAEIVAAGGGTTDTEETAAAILSNPVALSAIADAVAETTVAGSEICEIPTTAAAATAVPEPCGALTCAVALAGALSLRRRPRDGRRR